MTVPYFDCSFVRSISSSRTAEGLLSTFVRTPSEPVSAALVTRILRRLGQWDMRERHPSQVLRTLAGVVDCGVDWKEAAELEATLNESIIQFEKVGEKGACLEALRLQRKFFDNGLPITDASLSLLISLAENSALDYPVRDEAINNIDTVICKRAEYANDNRIFYCLKKLASDPKTDRKVSGAAMMPLSEVAVRCASKQWARQALAVTTHATEYRDPFLSGQAKQATKRIMAARFER